jgi:ubiquinol-cytochrome c reductase cytochrome c1 subunit
MKRVLVSAALALALALPIAAQAAEGTHEPPELQWSFEGLFGAYDRNVMQRGMQVYMEVCSSCHGLKYVRFRNLETLGYDAEQVKVIAAGFQVEDGPNDEGDMFFRDAIPADSFPSPFANDAAARASNGGALPPDLSLQAKRNEFGPNYIVALLTGYESDQPTDTGLYHNTYANGGLIAMPPPLFDGQVTYADGTDPTVEQMSYDVAEFLTWAAEPKLEQRKSMGIKVILFLLVLTGLFYISKRKIWARVEH